jgi:hypothetical protein
MGLMELAQEGVECQGFAEYDKETLGSQHFAYVVAHDLAVSVNCKHGKISKHVHYKILH